MKVSYLVLLLFSGYGGKQCENDIDECASNPCQHGGLCNDHLASYTCECLAGYAGVNCETNVDDCAINPCKNGGSCIDQVNDYKCVCELPFTGLDCQEKLDPCSPNRCRHNARCTPSSNYLDFACSCSVGYTGRLCEQDVDECEVSQPCRNGATCRNTNGSYQCICARGYEGRDCTVNTDDCASFPCQNGGTCLDDIGDYMCLCVNGFEGKHCEVDIDECLSNPCLNGATCNQYSDPCQNGGICRISEGGGYHCDCPKGTDGTNCELDSLNECDNNPCRHPDASCQDKLGDYACYCPPKHTGKNCEIYDRNSLGGLGQPVISRKDTTIYYAKDLELQRKQCVKNNCPLKRGNFRCDEECNTYACDFDGNDCSLGINPWVNCTAPIKCWEVFMDGHCDEECYNPQCLFDGRDCEKSLQLCNPVYDAYCQKHYANGHCDYGCNNAECNWDGLDCENEPPEIAEGVIAMIVLMEMPALKQNLVAFLRDMSYQLRTTVRVKKDRLGNDMIYEWDGATPINLQDTYYGQKHNVAYTKQFGRKGVKVYMEIDNRKCGSLSNTDYCFQSANSAAEFLAAKASRHTLSESFPIYQVNGVDAPPVEDAEEAPTNAKLVISN